MRHGTTLALALGLGGGALVWHFTRSRKGGARSSSAATASIGSALAATMTPASPAPTPSSPTTTAPPAPAPAAAGGATRPGPCALRLDAWGLRLDGAEVDIPTAVERCRVTGQADLTLEGNASAWTYAHLLAALGAAGVRITHWRV